MPDGLRYVRIITHYDSRDTQDDEVVRSPRIVLLAGSPSSDAMEDETDDMKSRAFGRVVPLVEPQFIVHKLIESATSKDTLRQGLYT